MLFKGTESTPFDCDEFTGAADLPVGVVGTRDYLALQGLIEPHNTSMAWVTTTESPLRSSEPFLLSYRLLQVLSLLFYSYNVWYAVKQLRAFGVLSKEWRREFFLSKEERDPAAKDKGPAVPVISLNLVRPPTPRAPLYYSALPATQPHHTTSPPSPPCPPSPASPPPRLLTFSPRPAHQATTISQLCHFINAGPTIEWPVKPLLPFFFSRHPAWSERHGQSPKGPEPPHLLRAAL